MISLQNKLFGRRFFDRRIYLFVAAIGVLFAFDGVAIYFSWYWTHQWLDVPVHAVAGLILSTLFYYVVFTNQYTARLLCIERTKQSLFHVMVFWVMVTAICWEIVEFVAGRSVLSPKFAGDLFTDIVVTCLGGLIGYTVIKILKLER